MNHQSQTSDSRRESHKHHYVPRFLLKPWTVNGLLNGYWWNSRRRRLDCNQKGPKAFCYAIDLLQLKEHQRGRDVLEHEFFGSIDTKGADARDLLLEEGPASLDNDRRCDFARLLLSLECRRPTIVHKLRDGGSFLAKSVDGDPEIRDAIKAEGLSVSPSAYAEEQGIVFEDRALSKIQGLVNNPKVGSTLVNLEWRVVHLRPGDGTLVLSDRPLVRVFGNNHPKESWFLPLGPTAIFFAARCPLAIDRVTSQKLAKELNYSSVRQTQKYVFCDDDSHTRWLGKHLRAL